MMTRSELEEILRQRLDNWILSSTVYLRKGGADPCEYYRLADHNDGRIDMFAIFLCTVDADKCTCRRMRAHLNWVKLETGAVRDAWYFYNDIPPGEEHAQDTA